MAVFSLKIENEAQMTALGARLATVLHARDVICLKGPLGAGKTTLARGLIGAFSGETNIPSPTFTLAETYQGNEACLWHFDLYRLENPEDVWELGLEDAFDAAISLIEWPDRIARLLPIDALELMIEIPEMPESSQQRNLQITAPDRWVRALQNAGIA